MKHESNSRDWNMNCRVYRIHAVCRHTWLITATCECARTRAEFLHGRDCNDRMKRAQVYGARAKSTATAASGSGARGPLWRDHCGRSNLRCPDHEGKLAGRGRHTRVQKTPLSVPGLPSLSESRPATTAAAGAAGT